MTATWAASQQRVEQSLREGKSTREELIEATGLAYRTIMSCIRRADVEIENTWPRHYYLRRSAFYIDAPVKVDETIVEPQTIEAEKLGPIWEKSRAKLGQDIEETIMTTMDRGEVLGRLETITASILGVIVALRSVEDSPEWREQIGID